MSLGMKTCPEIDAVLTGGTEVVPGVGVRLGVALGEGVRVAVGVGVGVRLGVALGEGARVAVGVGVGVALGTVGAELELAVILTSDDVGVLFSESSPDNAAEPLGRG